MGRTVKGSSICMPLRLQDHFNEAVTCISPGKGRHADMTNTIHVQIGRDSHVLHPNEQKGQHLRKHMRGVNKPGSSE